MVVDLAIEDHKYRMILVRHRLVASSKIDNRKTFVSEEYMRGLVFVYAFPVGAKPAMPHMLLCMPWEVD
jgi:hypothetical protein